MTLTINETRDIPTCHQLRRVVFIDEQSVPLALEVDGLDDSARHLLACWDGQPIGTARLLRDGPTGKIGRVCVLAHGRGRGIGVALIRAAVQAFRNQSGVKQVKLGAQAHALGFYAAFGFRAVGTEYQDAGIPHQDMMLLL